MRDDGSADEKGGIRDNLLFSSSFVSSPLILKDGSGDGDKTFFFFLNDDDLQEEKNFFLSPLEKLRKKRYHVVRTKIS